MPRVRRRGTSRKGQVTEMATASFPSGDETPTACGSDQTCIHACAEYCLPGCSCSKHARSSALSTKYNARHSRLRRNRGSASRYLCVDCGELAEHWSQVHGTNGMDLYNHYRPMCCSCHHEYDDIPRRSAETLRIRRIRPPDTTIQNLVEHNRRRTGEVRGPLSQETKDKISKFKKGVPLSPRHRDKISAALLEAWSPGGTRRKQSANPQ